MIILGIETSCDETAAAVLTMNDKRITILSNVVSSSASLQEKYGGILPEQAAREQLKMIIPVIEQALKQAFPLHPKPYTLNPFIDAIAVTYGPGLIGSLLVGVETAKTLAKVWDKPLIPVNHLLGHFYANWIDSSPIFPAIGLLVSGGHTDLIYFKSHCEYEYLGGTRDDAAGECFDKCARLLGFSYPGGPAIAQSAMKFKVQNSKFKIELPRPLINEKTFDFSFSGLKTATVREIEKLKVMKQFNNETIVQLAYELQQAIIDVLATKLTQAAQKYKVNQIIVAGGVTANQKLRSELKRNSQLSILNCQLHIPPANLCTDNGAMIAARAFFEKPLKNPLDLQANPSLSFSL